MGDLEMAHSMAEETGFPQIAIQIPTIEGIQKECEKHPIRILDISAQSFYLHIYMVKARRGIQGVQPFLFRTQLKKALGCPQVFLQSRL